MMLKVGAFVTLCIILNGLAFAQTTHQIKQVIKLEPRIRVEPTINKMTTIPLKKIRPFLEPSLILDCPQQFSQAPYIISENENRVEAAAGSVIYVKGITELDESQYTIYRAGKTYTHPVTGEILGFEALAIGTAEVKALGEPTTFKVKSATEGIEVGDRLYPSFVSELPDQLILRPANEIGEDGYILSARNGLTQIGRNQIVLISLGQHDGIEEGNILDIYQTGRTAVDPYSNEWRKKKILLPDNRIGNLLVYQVYDKLSLALVLEASEIIHLLDKVKSP